jgi:hypothetical protein
MRLAVVLALAAHTCGGPSSTPPKKTAVPTKPAEPPEPPVSEGEPLDATIPLFAGDSTELSALRGKVVILELSATDRPGWVEAHAHYRELLGEVPSLEVVAVSIDDAIEPLQAEWDRDPPPFVLGWDPQGALALRLGVKSLPTTFVLDAQGRIVGATAGFDGKTLQEIDGLVREALAPP